MTEVLTAAGLLTGSTFMLLAALGVVRLPDLLTRPGTRPPRRPRWACR